MSRPARRRPHTRRGRAVLTKEIIAAKALDIAGMHGFRSVTMRALAEELGVTVRALYNHVNDRQVVVDLAVDMMLDGWEIPDLDASRWEASVADYAWSLRRLYSRWPRALLVSLDEEAPPASVHPNRLIAVDRLLGLLREVGLDTPAALDVHRMLSLLVFSFALLVDYPAARSGGAETAPIVPAPWLDSHADLDVPALREAAGIQPASPDEQFTALVSTVTAQARSRLHESGAAGTRLDRR